MKYLFYAITTVAFCLSFAEAEESFSAQELNEITTRIVAERSQDETIAKRVDEILEQMTLEEKIGQMTQLEYKRYGGFEVNEKKLADLIRNYHIGSLFNGIAIPARQWFEYSKKIQEINLANSRLKIPVIYGIDHIHGASYLKDSTIFPHSINIAATFDPTFAGDEGRIIGLETADLGHHWIFATVGDIGLNPRYPRFYETYGEDPLVVSMMCREFTLALQNNPETSPYKQAACAKHFLGYSVPRNGWDRTPAVISDQDLYEFHVPAFKAMIDAGIKTVMINSSSINNEPIHASYRLLTTLLRDELGFKGLAVTDIGDINYLTTEHRVAPNTKEATYMAIKAGIDMSMTPLSTKFCDYMKELVNEKRIPEERLDLSVRRILRTKFELGLFDNPFPRDDRFDRIHHQDHIKSALNAARESIVLMKNNCVLPLKTPKNILVAGANADNKISLCGGWTYTWIPEDDKLCPKDMLTVYGALKKQFSKSTVTLAQGDDLVGADKADVIILVVGEFPYTEFKGNINDLILEEKQLRLIETAIDTGKPVILVMVAGRPRLITSVYDKCQAVIWAGLPGVEGGLAIAEIIQGAVNPSGKLPFTYPKYNGINLPYHHKPRTAKKIDISNTILAPFGHGLSYTTFEYVNLKLDKTAIEKNESLTAAITITNTGKTAGKETALWYISDKFRPTLPPTKLLKHFEKVELAAGKSKNITFQITPEALSYPNAKGKMQLDSGAFTLEIGGIKKEFIVNHCCPR